MGQTRIAALGMSFPFSFFTPLFWNDFIIRSELENLPAWFCKMCVKKRRGFKNEFYKTSPSHRLINVSLLFL